MLLNPGTTIDERYKIKSLLGSGGMGCVYLAEDLQLERLVAVKTMNSAATSEAAERFKREALALSKIVHKNIVRIYAFGDWQESCPYLIMELLKGKVLSQRLSEEGSLPVEAALRITQQVSTALTVSHRHGIIHRDIKPSNIFVTEEGTAKLIDFGLCKVDLDATNNNSQVLTQQGWTVGSLHYMSPQLCRALPADASSDIYALGIVTYELLAGNPPFESTDPMELMVMQIKKPVPELAQVCPHLVNAQKLDEFLEKCLAKKTTDRFNSTADLSAEINTLLETFAQDDPHQRPEAKDTKQALQQSRVLVAAVTLTILIGIAVGYSPMMQLIQNSNPGMTQESSNIAVHDKLDKASHLSSEAYSRLESTDPRARRERLKLTGQAEELLASAKRQLDQRPDENLLQILYWQLGRVKCSEENSDEARGYYLKALELAKSQPHVDQDSRKQYAYFLDDTKRFFDRRLLAALNLGTFKRWIDEKSKGYLEKPTLDLIPVLFERVNLNIENADYSKAQDDLEQAQTVIKSAQITDPIILEDLKNFQSQAHNLAKQAPQHSN
jgi:serine/threonine protein kinase